ncbi:hypothetical protein AMAG_05978 [Allomyces macrogynus ATCC 38327]|uniref:Fatty acid desaturase domain-containing protein n=1 Tax=Allomyces macrogynus (strain ATCC 38327) TaxID=578462 RepID=A0A0L0SDG7_ALLM3|nr:hypothetical protein AMAG_05978 [Allomyces macrogynus ATCC 38327]|eukprot:KNE60598.1 hypothetical protein AMAG_05978 [Allomyces macrogynus ATCC 38327]
MGEVWVRGPSVFQGYYNQPKLTQECLTPDGWLLTGDIGRLNPNGSISIVDRKKNLVKLAHGEYIALEKLESIYSGSKFVNRICVYADSHRYFPIAIVSPVPGAIQAVARAHGISYSSWEQLCPNKHHTFQGVYGKDPDLPLAIEWKLIKGSKILKLLWVFCFPFLYVLRGALMLKTPQTWEIINWIWTISSDLAVFSLCGPRGLAYLALSLWFGYGLHPAAAHFIQEHYTWNGGQETYSYYGSLNGPFMNIGYHNEHHDFTKVPWSKLPAIRAIAPEFYDTIAYHTSWVRVIYEFVMKDELGPQSRLGRHFEDHKNGRATIQTVRKSAKAE